MNLNLLSLLSLFCFTYINCSRFTKYFNPRRYDMLFNQVNTRAQALAIAQRTPSIKEKKVSCQEEKLCLTEECIHLSSTILRNIDASVPPCDDFYKFSCGGWQKENEDKIDEENIFYAANLNQMPENIDKIIKKLINKEIMLDKEFYSSSSYQHLFAFHKSCMDETNIENNGMKPAIDLLRSLEGFQVGRSFNPSTFDLTTAIISMSKYNGFPLFEISMDTDLDNSSQWQVAISAPKHKGLLKKLISLERGKSTPAMKEYFRHKGSKLLRRLLTDLNEEIFMFEFLNEFKSNSIEKNRQNNENPGSISANMKFHPKMSVKNIEELLKNSHLNSFKVQKKPSGVIADSVPVVPGEKNPSKNTLEYETKDKLKVKESFSKSEVESGTNSTLETFSDYFDFNKYNFSHGLNDFGAEVMEAGNALEDFFKTDDVNEIDPTDILNNLRPEDIEALYDYANHIIEDNVNDTVLDPPVDFLQSMGFVPTVTRQLLYREIEKELKLSKKMDIEETLKKIVFAAEFIDVNYSMKYSPSENTIEKESNYQKEEQFFNVSISSNKEESGIKNKVSLTKEAENAINAIVDFVMELRELEPSEREQIVVIQQGKGFNQMTLRELQKKFPLVRWQEIIRAVYGINLANHEDVVVFFPEYLDKLNKFLEKKQLWLMHSGMLSIFIYDQLKELVMIEKDQNRDQFCYMATKDIFTDVLSHMYLNHLGSAHIENLRKRVLPMMQKITETTVRFINESWMSEHDKEQARQKLRKVDLQVAALDLHQNISYIEDMHKKLDIRDQLFFHNVMSIYTSSRETLKDIFVKPVNPGQLIWSYTTEPFTINAFHLQSTNSIVFPEALFNPPYYYPDVPLYHNYASVGTPFAHELWHALDFTGTLFDGNGNMNRPFSEDMREVMKEKVSCFNDLLVDAFTEEVDIEGLSVIMVVDNNATVNENIADIASIAHSYASYFEDEEFLPAHSEPLLPALNYTREQLFFMGIAQPYCAILPSLAKVILMHMDEHLLHDMRVNGLMMNFPPFHKAFNCQPGDKMFSSRTCPIL